MRSRYRIRAAVLLLCLGFVVGGCGSSSTEVARTVRGPGVGKPPVTFGTKNFAEQFLLGQLYAQALRAKGFTVRLKSDVGATEIIYRALTLGTLDAYPEYTGVLNAVIGGNASGAHSDAESYAQAREVAARSGIAMLKPTPFVDRDELAVKPAFARRYHVRSIPDLRNVPRQVRVAGPPEFRTRVQGYVGLRSEYGLRNLRFIPLQIGDQYRALDSAKVDAADVFTTDGQLRGGRYVVLKDPRDLFGFQNAAPLVRQKVLDSEGPAFAATLNAVSSRLTTRAMRLMNASVMLNHESPAAVADRFLRANGLK